MKRVWGAAMKLKVLAVTFFLLIIQLAFAKPAVAQLSCDITINESNLTVQGTNSAETFCIYGSNVTVEAMGGDDTVIDFGSNNVIELDDGADLYDGASADESTVSGGAGDDVLIGTPGDDGLSGGAGDDTITGGLGADELWGEVGDDDLDGGDGADVIDGGDGDDSLIGGELNDKLNGGLGIDQLAGSAGDDYLVGESGSDTILGEDGNDLLVGGADQDLLDGGAGLNFCDYDLTEPLASACQYDDASPIVSDFQVEQSEVDVTSDPARIDISFTAIDQTGISAVSIRCVDPSVKSLVEFNVGKTSWSNAATAYNGGSLVVDSLLVSDTIYSAQVHLPLEVGSRPGIYRCYSEAVDIHGNRSWASLSDTFSVIRNGLNFDEDAPVITVLDIAQSAVDTSQSSARLDFQIEAVDQTSISYVVVQCQIEGTSRGFWADFKIENGNSVKAEGSNSVTVEESFADAKSLAVKGYFVLPQGFFPGKYECLSAAMDSLQNYTGAVPLDDDVQVYRTGIGFDDFAPSIDSFEITQAFIDVGSNDSGFDFSISGSDDNAIEAVYLACSNSDFSWDFGASVRANDSGELFAAIRDGSTINSFIADAKSFSLTAHVAVPFASKPGILSCTANTSDRFNSDTVRLSDSLMVYRTPAGQPSAPKELEFDALRPTSGTLNWAAPDSLGSPELTNYVAQYSSDGATWLALGSGTTSNTSLTIDSLYPDTDYWFRVRGDNGATSELDPPFMKLNWTEIKIHTPDAIVPDAPRNLVAREITQRGFVLDWEQGDYNGGSTVKNFTVEASKDGSNTWTSLKPGPSSSTNFTVDGATPGTTYQIRISAQNDAGFSQYLTGSVTTLNEAPAAPQNLRYVFKDLTSLTLVWDLPSVNGGSGITNYQIQVSSNSGRTWRTIVTPTNDLAFDISNLTTFKRYRFRVSAVNAVGASTYSDALSVIAGAKAPTAPADFATLEISATSAKISWSKPLNNGGLKITDYEVSISHDGGQTWLTVPHAASTSKVLKIKGLLSAIDYQVRIKAKNAVGLSEALSGSLRTLNGLPSAPQQLNFSDVADTSVILNWTAPITDGGMPVISFQIQMASDCKNFVEIQKLEAPAQNYKVDQLEGGRKYCFRMFASSETGTSIAFASTSVVTVGQAPNQPSRLAVSARSKSVVLTWIQTWEPGRGKIIDYLVEYSTNGGSTWKVVKKKKSASNSLTISGLKSKVSYQFRVAGINDVGTSEFATSIAVKVK